LVAGYTSNGSNFDIALARYYPDGTLDNNLDGDGILMTAVGSGDDEALCIALQDNGKIVAGGFSNNGLDNDFLIVRYNNDGSLDETFNSNGIVTTDFSSDNDEINSIAIQEDGKIVAAGSAIVGAIYHFALARYNTDGTLDQSFSDDGKIITEIGQNGDFAYGVAIQSDDKIVATGLSVSGFYSDISLVRYNSNGTLDNTFSYDGKLMTDIGSLNDYAMSLAIQQDGKIVVAGNSENGLNNDFTIVRYNTDGTLDDSFSEDGKQTTPIGTGWDYARSLAIQPDGKLLVAGYTEISLLTHSVLVRYDSIGSLDSTFATDGIAITELSPNGDKVKSVTLQPNGRIVVAGSATTGSNNDFAVARYISGLNIGILEFSVDNNAVFIYPNPVNREATLKYTLNITDEITVQLFDMQGKMIETIIDHQRQNAGEHELALNLSSTIPSGYYMIVFSSPLGRFNLKIMKGHDIQY
jgi:uncharacterized delta-60 repeat protein